MSAALDVNWAGVAAFKRAYAIYRERGYRTRALAAAYRHRLHWTEFVGGDVILTIGSGTTYTSTAPASAADLAVGAAVQVRLDRGSPMQAGEIEITK